MASIQLKDVSLAYPVYGASARRLTNTILSAAVGGRLLKDNGIVEVEALKNVNLTLKTGDRVGLIGHNGAGKTSLLKILAQIYEPTKGIANISSQANCLFDIMMGMDFELTGYENILLRGLILGLSKKECRKIMPDIEAFAELGEFMKMPIKTYSSGMLVRLAFGIITSIPSEILLIDEVVNVGDANFMGKAKARIVNLIHRSDIMVLSTHDLRLIREFCNKVVLLEKGKVKFYSDIDEIISPDNLLLPVESLVST